MLIAVTACKKQQLKQPTDVSFSVDINRNASNNGNLIFESGYILLSSFDVEGERQEGDPIAFSRSFSNGLLVNFDATGVIGDLNFDIPQGVYTELRVRFATFDDNGDATITVNGSFTNSQGTDVPIRFEFMSSETFEISGEDDVNSGVVVLDADMPSSAIIRLDPIYWFDILTTNQLENANLVDVNGVQTILINESNNDNLYDLLADRVDESTEAVFN